MSPAEARELQTLMSLRDRLWTKKEWFTVPAGRDQHPRSGEIPEAGEEGGAGTTLRRYVVPLGTTA